MNILAIGDVVGSRAVDHLYTHLRRFRSENKIDFVIANGENATGIRGLCAADAETLFDAGVDVITLGNHALGKHDLHGMLDNDPRLIRPANFPAEVPGAGYTYATVNSYRFLCMNVCGRVFMDAYGDPFSAVEKILGRESGKYDCAILDIHAEATSEKIALARYFDGKVHIMFGTHTHVVTADEQILPGGSAYQTDLGMTGPENGVIGTDAALVIKRFRTLMPVSFTVADGEVIACGTVFTLTPPHTVTGVRRVKF